MIAVNKREFFVLTLTIFLTIFAWVIYDLLTVKYQEIPKESFYKILQQEPKINKEIINFLKKKVP